MATVSGAPIATVTGAAAPAPPAGEGWMTSLTKWINELEWWLPSFNEALLYIVVALLLYIFGSLMYYNNIQLRVKQTSQCYKDKNSVTNNGSYYATAVNQNNDKLYNVNYDFGAKSYTIDCACNPGDVINTFPAFDIYNLATQKVNTVDHKLCSCDKQLYTLGSDSVYYTGYPGIVRFMNTAALYSDAKEKDAKADATFFDTALNGRGIA